MGSPVIMDSSTELLPSRTDAVHRHLLAGPHPEAVPHLDLLQGDVCFGAACPNPPGGLGGQSQQGLDGGAGLAAGLEFQHLAQQHQGDDEGRGLEIDRHLTGAAAEGGREDAGRQLGHQAIEVGHADAQADEGEHVQAAVHQGLPEAHEERPAGPEHRGGGERELHPAPGLGGSQALQGLPREHAAHGDDDEGDGQRHGRPEAPAHVDKFGVFFFLGGHGAGLQGHAALGARAGAILDHLRVHGAGVSPGWGRFLRFGRGRLRLCRGRRARNCSGSALNLAKQWGLQKAYSCPRGAARWGLSAGTIMPQTGSRSSGTADCLGARRRPAGGFFFFSVAVLAMAFPEISGG